jgi:hypothetical protein
MPPKQEDQSPSLSKYEYGAINVQNEDTEWLPIFNEELASNGDSKKTWLLGKSMHIGVAVILVAIAAALSVIHHNGSLTSKDTSAADNAPPGGKKSSASSFASPVAMGFQSTMRALDASPSKIWGDQKGPYPTNSWYLNLVSHHAAKPDDSTSVYTVPYIIDTAAKAASDEMTAGIRVHWPILQASDRNMQMVDDYKNCITLGTTDKDMAESYHVQDGPLSPLGVSLEWGSTNKKGMATHIVRGMPYATVQYEGGVLPMLYSYNGLATKRNNTIELDSKGETGAGTKLKCGVDGKAGEIAAVQSELEMHFINSDFTWIVFFSQPVKVSCGMTKGDEKLRDFHLNVVSYEASKEEPLTVRMSLLDQCTSGQSNIRQHCAAKNKVRASASGKSPTTTRAETKEKEDGAIKRYGKLLREGAHIYPASPQIDFIYPSDRFDEEDGSTAHMTIDWDAQQISESKSEGTSLDTSKLLMYALPHHQETLVDSSVDTITKECTDTFHGRTCLVQGDQWKLDVDLGKPMSFTASRPPSPEAIPALADALSEDINYQLPENLLRAAADTYFSGKILGRLARVVVIAKELKELASSSASVEGLKMSHYDDADLDDQSLSLSMEAAAAVQDKLPSEEEVDAALDDLKKGVAIWLSAKSEAPFIYDQSWGGLVNCGCRYVGKADKGHCNNTFPDCPALVDVNEDFGNGTLEF